MIPSKLPSWVKLPNRWIEDGGLKAFRWTRGEGANEIAALMALTVISHHIVPDTGIARLTYNAVCERASLSRAKLSAGLDVLSERKLIERGVDGRGTYHMADYDPVSGWAKFPAQGLYRNGVVTAFSQFHLRLRSELDALKLYFLFASRRDRQTNMASITYDLIAEYSGVQRDHIRQALSLLAANALVHIEHVPSSWSENGIANAYRLAHLNTSQHMGTTGRRSDLWNTDDD